jgi:hypothetical protein
MQLRRIDKIGVELEGGWNYYPDQMRRWDGEMGDDCSVRCEGDEISGGELRSAPSDWRTIEGLMRNCYPDVVDSSCGMHVHISLKSKLDYGRLMSRSFYDFFLREIIAWGSDNVRAGSRFWRRLDGGEYAQADIFEPELGILGSADRYAFLNFNAYQRYGTIECRLLPMFDTSTLAIKAVRAVLEITEGYLRTRPRETIKRRTLSVPYVKPTAERAVYADATAQPLELNYSEPVERAVESAVRTDDGMIEVEGCTCGQCQATRQAREEELAASAAASAAAKVRAARTEARGRAGMDRDIDSTRAAFFGTEG